MSNLKQITDASPPGSRIWVNFCKNAANAVSFCRKCGDCSKCVIIITSPHFNAFLRKIHSKIYLISYKKSTHRLFVAKECTKCGESDECGEKKFHHISSHFLQKFTAKFTSIITKIHRVCFPTFNQSDLNSDEKLKK